MDPVALSNQGSQVEGAPVELKQVAWTSHAKLDTLRGPQQQEKGPRIPRGAPLDSKLPSEGGAPDHIRVKIHHSGAAAQDSGDSRHHAFWDPHAFMHI